MKTSELIDILDRLLDGASRILRHDVRVAPPFEEVEPNKANSRLINFWMKQFPLESGKNKAKDPVTRAKHISWMIKDKQIKASGAVGERKLDLFEDFWDRHEVGKFQHETLKTWLREAKGLEALGAVVALIDPEISHNNYDTLSAMVMKVIRKQYSVDEDKKHRATNKEKSFVNGKPPKVFKRFKQLNTMIGLVYDLEPFTHQERENLLLAGPDAFSDQPLKKQGQQVKDLEPPDESDERVLVWGEGIEFVHDVLTEEASLRS